MITGAPALRHCYVKRTVSMTHHALLARPFPPHSRRLKTGPRAMDNRSPRRLPGAGLFVFSGPGAPAPQFLHPAKTHVEPPGQPFQDQWRIIRRSAVHQHHPQPRLPPRCSGNPAAYQPLRPAVLVPQHHRQAPRLPGPAATDPRHNLTRTPGEPELCQDPVQHHDKPGQKKQPQNTRQSHTLPPRCPLPHHMRGRQRALRPGCR